MLETIIALLTTLCIATVVLHNYTTMPTCTVQNRVQKTLLQGMSQ